MEGSFVSNSYLSLLLLYRFVLLGVECWRLVEANVRVDVYLSAGCSHFFHLHLQNGDSIG